MVPASRGGLHPASSHTRAPAQTGGAALRPPWPQRGESPQTTPHTHSQRSAELPSQPLASRGTLAVLAPGLWCDLLPSKS